MPLKTVLITVFFQEDVYCKRYNSPKQFYNSSLKRYKTYFCFIIILKETVSLFVGLTSSGQIVNPCQDLVLESNKNGGSEVALIDCAVLWENRPQKSSLRPFKLMAKTGQAGQQFRGLGPASQMQS